MASNTISESYASPGLRWGLLLDDHPGADRDCRGGLASECGVPDGWGGDAEVVICTITRPGLPDVVAYKPTNGVSRKDPDAWNVLETKALGRALKRAGYPDDLRDLKALLLWRRRNAEVAAVGSGDALALPPGVDPETGELEAAGRTSPDDVGGDDSPEEAELVESTPTELAVELGLRLGDLSPAARRRYVAWAKATWTDGPDDADDYQAALAMIDELAEEAP